MGSRRNPRLRTAGTDDVTGGGEIGIRGRVITANPARWTENRPVAPPPCIISSVPTRSRRHRMVSPKCEVPRSRRTVGTEQMMLLQLLVEERCSTGSDEIRSPQRFMNSEVSRDCAPSDPVEQRAPGCSSHLSGDRCPIGVDEIKVPRDCQPIWRCPPRHGRRDTGNRTSKEPATSHRRIR